MNLRHGAILLASLLMGACQKSPELVMPNTEADAQAGEYLVAAANCISCHTRSSGPRFAGGVAFETPFGTIYSSNITPDKATGIGNWTMRDFRRAMHEGIAADGHRLFPAFPYSSFTKVTDQDVAAMFAYLRTLTPVTYTPPANSFLLKQRWALRAWNSLFFEQQRFASDADKTVQWNRGAYLVEALGHCSACHSPRNRLMAESVDRALSGGSMQDSVAPAKTRRWSAVNLTAAKAGLASWSLEELSNYLHTGISKRGGTFGPMNDVIVNSLSKLTAEDVTAMAVYLKALPEQEYQSSIPAAEQSSVGRAIYEKHCAKCHQNSGRGGPFGGPPLAGSAVVQTGDPASLINIIIYGPQVPDSVSFGAWETMQPYGEILDDSQIVAVCNFIRGSWGNSAGAVSASQIRAQR